MQTDGNTGDDKYSGIALLIWLASPPEASAPMVALSPRLRFGRSQV
jgi:hypothetical protein